MAEGNVRIYVGADGTGYQPSPIAQSVERSAVNRKVGGSSPPGRALFLPIKLLLIIVNNRFIHFFEIDYF